MKMIQCFFLCLSLIFTGRTPAAATPSGDKMPLEKASQLIKSQFYSKNDQMKIEEITSDEIWDKMKTQIYRVEKQTILYYAITNKKVTDLGGHYSYTFNYVVCDLDQDKKYELIYTYQFGSGVSRGILSVYQPNKTISCKTACVTSDPGAVYHFNFDKKSDSEVYMSIEMPSGILQCGRLVLKQESGHKVLMVE